MAARIGDPSAAQDRFGDWVAAIESALAPGERYTATCAGESTDFARLNRGKVRQAGSVEQHELAVRLVQGARHAEHALAMSGNAVEDRAAIVSAIAGLRAVLPDLADDPHLLLPDRVANSRVDRQGALPAAEAVVDEILAAADGLDLVGLYAAGPVWRGFANSDGQRNWHAATTFNLQWSLVDRGDKAVKSAYAGFSWSRDAFASRMQEARERLALVARPSTTLAPGRYRAFLAPSALEEIAGLLSWGAFSARALETRQSPLARMRERERLDPRVTIVEDIDGGVAPGFQSEGFARPGRVPLVRDGELVGALTSPRTAREFSLDANGANAEESPEAFAMSGGELAASDALAALDDGLWIGNLWYTNYSDRPACRITGMTRFATFRVQRGRIVAPVDVLRFDDSLYRMLGSNLEALTRETELLLSADSYRSRHLTSARLPGALVREIAFTL
ncbi:MAG TPA: metallopeptidase TldD-related protein [Casimicrobiaceae bacterium]|nr:metallopeptidase TldD-related protein [Casimicrobiaceae bacterium]